MEEHYLESIGFKKVYNTWTKKHEWRWGSQTIIRASGQKDYVPIILYDDDQITCNIPNILKLELNSKNIKDFESLINFVSNIMGMINKNN
jgi:hypothetical protein